MPCDDDAPRLLNDDLTPLSNRNLENIQMLRENILSDAESARLCGRMKHTFWAPRVQIIFEIFPQKMAIKIVLKNTRQGATT